MGHVHISTEFMFVIVLFILGILGLIVWYFVSKNRYKRDADIARSEALAPYTPNKWENNTYLAESPAKPFSEAYRASNPYPNGRWSTPPAPVQQAPVVVHSGGNNDMMTGVLLGSVLSNHNHDTVVHEKVVHDSPSPAPSSGGFDYSWGGSSSSDSGSSSSSSDSGGFSFDSSSNDD
jgi:hypothetical protein